MKRYVVEILLGVVALSYTSCELITANKTRTPLEDAAIEGVPVPHEFKLAPPKTKNPPRDALSFRTGTVTYTGPASLDQVARFLRGTLPLSGWEPLVGSEVDFPPTDPLDRSQSMQFRKARSVIRVTIGESRGSRPNAPSSIIIVQLQNR